MAQVLLTIGGSDSGGGAGIQADIKTFSALGFHGTSAITAVTAQNTLGVQRIFCMKPEAVSAQLGSITDDFRIAFAKTGMLCSAEIVIAVAEHLSRARIPLVLDPVIEAEAGGRLTRPDAVEAIKELLVPMACVVTPNIFEALALTGITVKDAASAEHAAREIKDLGAGAVMIKGGHLDCTDFLLEEGGFHQIHGSRVRGGNHGVGCTYSAALTAFLAKGCSMKEASSAAKSFASNAISHSMDVGRGAAPVNQTGFLREEADRFRVLSDVQRAASLLLAEKDIWRIIPEAGLNIGMAISDASTPADVAEGRLIRSGREAHQSGCVKFGAGSDTSNMSNISDTILEAMRFDSRVKAAICLCLDHPEVCRALGLDTVRLEGEDWPRMTGAAAAARASKTAKADIVPYVTRDDQGGARRLKLLGLRVDELAAIAIKLKMLSGRMDGKL
jgi:hydroxymethylpyrimidine kinase/phosphomethylpyrimidine kinase